MELDTSVPYEAMIWLEREERWELQHLGRLLTEGSSFVDVGANLGLWTLRAATLVGRRGRVHALEPNPALFERLNRHVERNGFGDRVRTHPVGAASRIGEGFLDISHGHNEGRVVLGAREEGITAGLLLERVRLRALDDLLVDQPVDGVKIDVEGFEAQVLAGASRLIVRDHPWIVVEWNTLLGPGGCLGEWEVHRMLVEQGYGERPRLVSSRDMEAVGPSWTIAGYCNLLYVPSR